MGKTKTATSKKHAASRTSSTTELLLEIGSEELPCECIAPALASLKEQAERLLAESRLAYRSVRTYGTPRRLVLVVDELAAHQAATLKESMGPSKTVAFDQTGQPTKAAIGFAAGQGMTVQELQIRQTPKGEYLFAVKREEGRPTRVVLTELVPQVVAKLSFPKSMKWNDAGVRFARPVRWLMALHGSAVLPIKIAGIKAGNKTYGHRVLGGGQAVAIRDYATYESALKRLGVLVDQDKRRMVIQEQLVRVCQKAGIGLNADEELLEQATYSTEWPVAIVGSFKSEYLSVPSEILITSMKEHQGFFSVRDKKSGALDSHFVAVANNEVKDMSLIRQGNERVLAARLADAMFFFNEDRKTKLIDRVEKLKGVVFHQRIGTLYQKTSRTVQLATWLAGKLGLGHDQQKVCGEAAELSKADLVTGIVGEFPTLQGLMGSEYAKHDGKSDRVSKAIRDQYLPRGMEGALPETIEGKIVSLADRLDTIAAFFRAGLTPKGSEDPFALRRHAISIVRIIIEGRLRFDLHEAIREAESIVTKEISSKQSMLDDPLNFVFERFRFYVGTVQDIIRDDVMAAVCETAYKKVPLDLVDILERMKALQIITMKPEFDSLIIGFKRAHRLVEKETWDRKPVDVALFKDPAETELHRQNGLCRKDFDRQMQEGEYRKALDALVRMKPAIDAFFTGVMVNTEDPALRNNRLSLLKDVDEFFMSFADFSRIVVQGS